MNFPVVSMIHFNVNNSQPLSIKVLTRWWMYLSSFSFKLTVSSAFHTSFSKIICTLIFSHSYTELTNPSEHFQAVEMTHREWDRRVKMYQIIPTVVEVIEWVSAHIDYLNKNSSVILTSQIMEKSYDVNGDKMELEAMKRSRRGKNKVFLNIIDEDNVRWGESLLYKE